MDARGSGELLVWSEAHAQAKSEALRACFLRILKRNGFEVEKIDGRRYVVTPTRDVLEHEATHVGVVKRLTPEAQIEQGMEDDDFDYTTRDAFQDVDSVNFFTPAETCMLAHRILSSIKVDAELEAQAILCAAVQVRQLKVGQPALQSLRRVGIVDEVMPIHNPPFIRGLLPKMGVGFPDCGKIQEYYGDAVGLYFAWMAFMRRWLVPPACMGAATFLIHQLTGETVEDSHYAPFFSAAMIVWACLFVKFWQREEARWSVQWGSVWTDARVEVRPEFTGEWRKSPVTGEPEMHFPAWRRWPRFAVSISVTSCLLIIAFCVMIASLNLQGYIQDEDDMFRLPLLARYSAPGAVLDPLRGGRGGLVNFLMPLVPVVVHVATIFVLNQIIYRNVAEWLTEWENHKTQAAHRTSLIVKRVCFEAFDCYVALFYLAFWHRDILKVRAELKALFTADCVRRLATEVLLPWLMQRANAATHGKEMAAMKRAAGGRPALVQALQDSLKDEYEDFDDFIEMSIQFGYVTMFASAMPAAAAIACGYTFIEMRSDLVKLLFLQRRPVATRATSIGIWAKVIEFQAWLAIATNSVVFAFSSDQVAELAPALFRTESGILPAFLSQPDTQEKVLQEGSGRWLVAVWALTEHALVLIAVVLYAVIPSVPEDVQDALARKRWLEVKTAQAQRHDARIALVAHAKSQLPGGIVGNID